MITVLLSIVIPTFNEYDAIVPLLERLQQAMVSLQGRYEILIVDDASPDGTADRVMQHTRHQPDVHVLRREGKPDLSSAIVYGFSVAQGDFLMAMDADGQHDPQAVLPMLQASTLVDLVMASRYTTGSRITDWSHSRQLLSRWATGLSRRLLRLHCSDPLSGFFLIRRRVWLTLSRRLQPVGFKLLLEILKAEPELRCTDVPYHFTAREHGRSKFSFMAVWHFLRALWRLRRPRT
jgi:dolichol-phosphate mannosyltransferase